MFPTNIGNLARDYAGTLGLPISPLEVRVIIHVEQFGHHEYIGGLIKSETFLAHWGLETAKTTWSYGINAGEMGSINRIRMRE